MAHDSFDREDTVPDALSLIRLSLMPMRISFQVAVWSERQMLALLRARMDAIAPSEAATPAGATVSAAPDRQPLGERMIGLLDQALEQTPASSTQALFEQIVSCLVPDEARILGALSDGSKSPLVHIRARSRGGTALETVLENASLIGRMANATLPQLTPTYIGQLLSLGLIEIGAEDYKLKDDYQILLADPHVLKALRDATRGPLAPKVERLTVRMSPLGHQLWAVCFPEEGSPT